MADGVGKSHDYELRSKCGEAADDVGVREFNNHGIRRKRRRVVLA